ncbi:MAG: FecR family protein [Cytophagia bacterium]|nr:MAG: FecR family protein [Cytophagales bacterium]TAG36355.1 MAG: FecR family protein [Cytophagia bacterium]TAG77924.1 MAG: FecR family protein [Cytophagales bacterium]
MKFENYTVKDFLLDDRFVDWVKQGTEDAFWQDILTQYPQKRAAITQARSIVLATTQLPVQSLKDNDLAAMWQKIQWRIQKEETQDTPVRGIGQRWWWAAAASVLLVVGWWSWQQPHLSQQGVTYEKLVSQVGVQKMAEQTNENTKPLLVNLPDGSSVLLQKGGKLSYATNEFNVEKREVYLSGEAFFEVKKETKKPFFVYANELVTKVLGTSFTVRAFKDTKQVEVIVKTGKVAVFTQNDPEKKYKLANRALSGVVLLPNQQIVLDRTNLRLSTPLIAKPERLTLPAQNLSFEFDDVLVSEVIDAIEKAYGVEVVYDAELLSECKLTAHLTDEPLYDKIKMICQALDAHYEVVDAQIVIQTKGCK